MNRDEVIRMARQATRQTMDDDRLYSFTEKSIISEFSYLERFADLVAAAEREACAQICDAEASCEGIAQRCAAEIRKRGE